MKLYGCLPCLRTALVAGAMSVACDATGDRPRAATAGNDTGPAGRAEVRRITIDSAAGTTVPAATDPMPGMDHGRMAGPGAKTPMTAATGTMSDLDRSKPGRSPGPGMSAMDHARMSAPARPDAPRSAAPTPGMAAMPGMAHEAEMRARQNPPANDVAMLKLQRLLARLVADSVVRSRILADSFLRSRWQDSSVRRILLLPP